MSARVSRLAAALLALLCLLPADLGDAQRSPMGRWGLVHNGTGTGLPNGSCSDTYDLYTDLCLDDIPWHNGSGGWGAQVALVAPTLPTTTITVSCSTASCANTNAAIAGKKITLTGTGWTAADTVGIHADDVEIVLSSGVTIGAIEIGGFGIGSIARFYLHGDTPGTHSGGLMGQLRNSSFTTTTDVAIDGIDLNGDSNYGGSETNQAFRVDGITRLAVTHVRAIAAGYVWLGTTRHVVIAGSSFYGGAASRASVGYSEGWTIRNASGPLVIVDSDIRGTRYANIRAQSIGGSDELLYIARTKLVAIAEGRSLWQWDSLDNEVSPAVWRGQGAILEDSDVYTYADSGCGFGEQITGYDVDWSLLRNNVFHGADAAVFTQAELDATAAADEASTGGDHDWSTGNTFSAWDLSEPTWGGAGAADAVALPAGFTLETGEGSCPGAYTP